RGQEDRGVLFTGRGGNERENLRRRVDVDVEARLEVRPFDVIDRVVDDPPHLALAVVDAAHTDDQLQPCGRRAVDPPNPALDLLGRYVGQQLLAELRQHVHVQQDPVAAKG